MATVSCVYLGYISDIAGGKPEEPVQTGELWTLRLLIAALGSKYPQFQETFITASGTPVPSRQILIKPKGKQTEPPAKGLETLMEDGMRIIFW